MIKMNKKADMMWDKIGGWVYILILLIVLLTVLFIFRDQIFRGIAKVGDMLTFGGD